MGGRVRVSRGTYCTVHNHRETVAWLTVRCHLFISFFWLLQDLYVRPSFRGNGIGQRLVTLAAMAAQRGGCARVTWQVLDW